MLPSMLKAPRIALLIIAGVMFLGAAALWYASLRPAPPPVPSNEPLVASDHDAFALDQPVPDPRLTFPTSFRNVKPDVKYVGDAQCNACHAGLCKSYHAHPMGRSAAVGSDAIPIEKYDAVANNPVSAGPYRLRVTQTANGAVHHMTARDADGNPLPEYTITADLAIGSGTRGRSYLTIENGAVWQSPVSWFSHESRWDVSPGFDLGIGGRRAIVPDCLFCHVNRVDPVQGARNRYHLPLLREQASIGCERCHGPGALHVAERVGGSVPDGMDTSIVNPKHLTPELRASVCAQCHLQGEERVPRRGRDVFEFRPGLPFEQFVTVFVQPPDVAEANRSVGQFEQMEQSRCFTASGGRLGCTSCHDPHATPGADRARFYRARCLVCHESKGCSASLPERQGKQDSCIVCHMPASGSSNVPHASVTNHRIPRRPGEAPVKTPSPSTAIPLLAFREGPYAPPEPERARALGIALTSMATRLPVGPARQRIAALARDRLLTSLATWRGDSAAWLSLSYTRALTDEVGPRLDAATAAVQLMPKLETALAELVEAALAARQFDQAEEVATRWVRLSPTAIEPRLARAAVFKRRGAWVQAEADVRAALAVHPLHPEVRLYLAVCRHHLGDAAGGQKEAATAAGLATSPQQRAAMLAWFRTQTR